MKHIYKIFSLRYIIYSLLLLLSVSTYWLVSALNTISTWYQTTASNITIDAHSECRQVRHTWSESYFVPTATSAEWTAFRNNHPSDVVLNGCIDRYPGCDTDDITIWTFTIAACNVWATTASTNWSVSRGYYFQWGRNKSFVFGDTSQQSSQIVWSVGLNPSTDTFWFVWNSNLQNATWANTDISQNWWWANWDNNSRQGPCAPGYRVPSQDDWQSIIAAWGWGNNGNMMRDALLLPYAWGRFYDTGNWFGTGSHGYYWTSTPASIYGHVLWFNSSNIYTTWPWSRANGYFVRCFKN